MIDYTKELLLTAFLALVVSFACSRFVAACLQVELPQHHALNNRELFVTSYFSALFAILVMRIIDYRNLFRSTK